MIVCEDVSGAKSAERLARRVTAALDASFRVALHDGVVAEVRTGASVGVVVTSGLDSCADLLRRADEAMYEVRAAHKAAQL